MKVLTAILVLINCHLVSSQMIGAIVEHETNGVVKKGLIQSGKKWLIEPIYDDVIPCFTYSDSPFYFVVVSDGKSGLYDFSGNLIIPIKYDFITVKSAFILVQIGGKVGAFSLSGKKILEPIFQELFSDQSRRNEPMWHESETYISFRLDGKFGVVDTSGNEIIPAIYDYAIYDHGDYFEFWDGSLHYLLRQDGKLIASSGYRSIQPLHQGGAARGMAIVEREDRFGLIDSKGDPLLPTVYTEIDFEATDSLYRLFSGTQYGVALHNGEIILEAIYDNIHIERHSIIFSLNGKFGALDFNGKTIVSMEFDHVSEEIFFLQTKKGNTFGLIDTMGRQLISNADEIKYSYGCIFVKRNELWEGIDFDGNQLFSSIYEQVGDKFIDGLLRVQKNGKWGFINEKGEVKIPIIYDSAKDYSTLSGRASVQKNGKTYRIGENGTLQLEEKFDAPIDRNPFRDNNGGSVGSGAITLGEIERFSEIAGNNPILINRHFGVVHGSDTILPCIYDEINFYDPGIICANLNGFWKMYDATGNLIIDFNEDKVREVISLDAKGHDNLGYLYCRCIGSKKNCDYQRFLDLDLGLNRYTISTLRNLPDSTNIYRYPDTPAEFPELNKFIKANLKLPKQARKREEVYEFFSVKFIVEADGSLTSIRVDNNSIEAFYVKEAIRVISKMPKWTPAVLNGRTVRTEEDVLVIFSFDQLRNSKK